MIRTRDGKIPKALWQRLTAEERRYFRRWMNHNARAGSYEARTAKRCIKNLGWEWDYQIVFRRK